MDGWSAIPAMRICAPTGEAVALMMERISKSPLFVGAALCAAGERPSPNSDNSFTGYRHLPMRKRTFRLLRSWLCRIPGSRLMLTARIRFREPQLANSPRLDQLIRDGKLYISLKDAISLAIENNLDVAIARYNLPIADTDLLRTKAGGSFRGVNTGVVQGTPGGGVGGFGTGAPGAGAGGTSGGAGGAGAGAAGIVQSTLGIGAPVQSYDPCDHRQHGHRAPGDSRSPTFRSTACHRCSRTPASSTWPTSRRFRPEPASRSSRTITAKRRTAFSAAWFPRSGPITE